VDVSRRNALVVTQSLTKRYGRVAALEDCALTVSRGEVFGLLGPNGAGKTTLLRLLMGFLRATRGSATIAGRDCWRDSVAVHAGVSYLPGDVRLTRGMRGRDMLSFLAGLRGEADAARSVQLAERLGLDLSRKVAQMSTGMRQKVALAAVLAVDVPLLVLDEPTSNLDPSVRRTVQALIREAQTAGRTVIFSSHVLSEVEQVCDRVAILRAGRVVHDQVMSQIRRGHRIRARLRGEMPTPPEQLRGALSISGGCDGQVTIDAPGDLAPLLGWLATLPIAEVHIEPIGLAAVYEQYHPPEDADSAESPRLRRGFASAPPDKFAPPGESGAA
jgi:ABC-2 type transport system ATP-binding protein